ncbi:AI-2E family transporter [Hamadaea tsunoensis]|uniref:AI-2E family transporter n=1 Tax=Hamadaea tsunoensis TaxID=53368 RepID=UPI0004276F52|nr:AI-2E family transporter [Hamadaea tsunoensis]
MQSHDDQVREWVTGLNGSALHYVQSVASGVVGTITIFVLAYLMVLEGPIIIDACLALFDDEAAARIRRVGHDCARTITGYISGNLLISLIAGTLTYIVLLILHVPFAGLIALFVAITDLIPLIGAALGAIVAILAALTHSVSAAVILLVFFVIYQLVENHLLQPLIFARTVNLNPLTVLVAILVAGELAGVLGALLAIPLAGIAQVIVRDVWDTRRGRLKPEPTTGPAEDSPETPRQTSGARDESRSVPVV